MLGIDSVPLSVAGVQAAFAQTAEEILKPL
jgi:hypothetical protein